MFRTKTGYRSICLMVLMLVLSFSAAAQDKDKKDKKDKKPLTGTPVMWKDPTDLESRNLILGAGGEEMKPDISKVTFIEEKKGSFIPWFVESARIKTEDEIYVKLEGVSTKEQATKLTQKQV